MEHAIGVVLFVGSLVILAVHFGGILREDMPPERTTDRNASGSQAAVAMLSREKTERRSIAGSLAAASVVVMLVFVLTYVSAWVSLRQPVATGDYGCLPLMMKNNFTVIRQDLSDFAEKQGHYPDSLEEVAAFKDYRPYDAWGRPYQYTKTEAGFRLQSLGRDGEPGGIGLDADIESDPEVGVHIEPTLSQFLFDAPGSATLCVVALLGSLGAGTACFLASRRVQYGENGRWLLLWSVLWTTVVSLGICFILVAVHTMGEHH